MVGKETSFRVNVVKRSGPSWELGLAAVALFAAASVGAGERSRLEKLEEDIRRHRADLKRAEVEVKTTAEAVYELDKKLEEIDKTVAELAAEMTETSGRLAAVQADLAVAERELAARQDKLRRHLQLVYKLGRYPLVRFVIGAGGMNQLLRRLKFALILAREDRRLARAVARHAEEVRRDREAILRELEYLKALRDLNARELEVSRARRAQKQRLLERAKKRRASLTARLAELKKEKAELESLIRSTTRRAPKSGKVSKRVKGEAAPLRKIKPPTPGEVIRRFGLIIDDRYDTATQNDGVDFAAPAGSEVRAVMPGKVVFADWFRGYGKLMIIDHGGGYTSIYAHLADFKAAPGDTVAEGQVIGSVGDTGYVAGPTLHFEIRRDGIAVDPERWF